MCDGIGQSHEKQGLVRQGLDCEFGVQKAEVFPVVAKSLSRHGCWGLHITVLPKKLLNRYTQLTCE